MIQEFPHHPVPMPVDNRAIDTILLNAESVVEAQHQRQFMDQLNPETLEAIVAIQLRGRLFQHAIRSALNGTVTD